VTLRIETDLDKVEQNTRILVDRLAATGIRVTGITKAVLGSPGVGAAMLRPRRFPGAEPRSAGRTRSITVTHVDPLTHAQPGGTGR
jgi:hypothetical protein